MVRYLRTDMNIFIIVATYNGEAWIRKCLDSLIGSTIAVKIIIIDNHSIDQTLNIINTYYNHPNIKLVKNSQNIGFGRANNIGLKLALQERADFIFLINQDAWIESNTIEKLVEIHKQNPEYGIISPIHLNREKTNFEAGFFSFIANKDRLLLDSLLTKKYLNVYQVDFVNAAIWCISKECLFRVGGFDPLFPHYGEDSDYVNRVIFHNFKIGICPHCFAVHDTDTNRSKKESIKGLAYRKFIHRLVLYKRIGEKEIRINRFMLTFLFVRDLIIAMLKADILNIQIETFIFFRMFKLIPKLNHHKTLCKERKPTFLK
jgi:GT2 family glycosyltransferase